MGQHIGTRILDLKFEKCFENGKNSMIILEGCTFDPLSKDV